MLDTIHVKSSVNSPRHGQRIHRAGSVDTLSPCESIASDDMMLDYECSDASSYEEQRRLAPIIYLLFVFVISYSTLYRIETNNKFLNYNSEIHIMYRCILIQYR